MPPVDGDPGEENEPRGAAALFSSSLPFRRASVLVPDDGGEDRNRATNACGDTFVWIKKHTEARRRAKSDDAVTNAAIFDKGQNFG
jgi:hypothetical protein